MEIPILIEPVKGGRFRAGEPFGISVEGANPQEASDALASALRARLQTGAQLAILNLGNGSLKIPPIHFDPVPEDDWFFNTLEEEIAANRRREDETDQ